MRKKDSITLRGHHIAMLGEYFYGRNLDGFASEYGKEFIDFIKEIYDKVINKEYLNIEIVDGPDILCDSKLPICKCKNNTCGATQNLPEDTAYLEEYKLKGGKNSIKKFIAKIRDYKKETGFSSPRTKAHFMLDEFF